MVASAWLAPPLGWRSRVDDSGAIEPVGYTRVAAWDVVLLAPVVAWYERLLQDDPRTAEQVAAALDLLEEFGPSLGRPLVDTLRGSRLPNLKELRPGSRGRSEVRLLFAFDPQRRAVVLVAGDKAGRWRGWYRQSIRSAEARYAAWIAGEADP